MTTKNYDSEFCGRVPLNQTNLIQPHGVLMIVQKGNWQILQVSENVDALLNKPATEVVNTFLTDYITPEQKENIQNRFEGNKGGKIPFTFSFNGNGTVQNYLSLVQAHEAYLVIEIEKEAVDAGVDSFINVYQELKYVIAAIDAATTIEEAAQVIVQELKRISGFDKVMVYTFDNDWNGTVIAEAKEEGMDAYLGLKFPASDIPKQAREMYRKNPYRLIPNADYVPVRLYPVINPVTHAFTDLSDTNLRSVAGVHIEYLHNMKVTASMSTRIVKGDVLWGLISCHHRTAKYLSYQTCSLFELLSNIISAKINLLEHQQQALSKATLHGLYTTVVESIYKNESLQTGLLNQQQNVLALLEASGIAVVLNKDIQTWGTTPPENDIEDLIFWLQTNGIQTTFQENHLAGKYDNAESYAAEASGVLALPIQPERGNYILAFRPEVIRQVNWGGNPDEAITFAPDKSSYHPRNSFQQWQETVRKTALPWNKEALQVAEDFRSFAIAFTLSKM